MIKKSEKITKPLFFATIVPKVLNDPRISFTDIAILSVVINLTATTGKCFANNRYFVKHLKCGKSTVSKSLNDLEKYGYIMPALPDPGRGGRGRFRTVPNEYIYKSADYIAETSQPKYSHLPSKKAIHNNIINEEDNYKINIKIEEDNTKVLSITDEKRIVEKTLIVPYRNKWGIYEECKSLYNIQFPIEWDEKNIKDLITLCNKINKTWLKLFKNTPGEKRFEVITGVFDLLVSSKPTYFTDCLPISFVKFFRRVIAQENFLNDIRFNDYLL